MTNCLVFPFERVYKMLSLSSLLIRSKMKSLKVIRWCLPLLLLTVVMVNSTPIVSRESAAGGRLIEATVKTSTNVPPVKSDSIDSLMETLSSFLDQLDQKLMKGRMRYG